LNRVPKGYLVGQATTPTDARVPLAVIALRDEVYAVTVALIEGGDGLGLRLPRAACGSSRKPSSKVVTIANLIELRIIPAYTSLSWQFRVRDCLAYKIERPPGAQGLTIVEIFHEKYSSKHEVPHAVGGNAWIAMDSKGRVASAEGEPK
jgi:hypothetical protein